MTVRPVPRGALPRRLLQIALVGVVLACTSPVSPRIPPCGSLSELDCIVSGQCTLVLASPTAADYRCRAAQNACESGFIQRTGSQQSCEATPGCLFEPGSCYCPPDLVCVCGGGPPPQCRPAAS